VRTTVSRPQSRSYRQRTYHPREGAEGATET
jgi:hypothetical protein